jgi:hypothetical protein
LFAHDDVEALAGGKRLFIGFGAWHKHRYIISPHVGLLVNLVTRSPSAMLIS